MSGTPSRIPVLGVASTLALLAVSGCSFFAGLFAKPTTVQSGTHSSSANSSGSNQQATVEIDGQARVGAGQNAQPLSKFTQPMADLDPMANASLTSAAPLTSSSPLTNASPLTSSSPLTSTSPYRVADVETAAVIVEAIDPDDGTLLARVSADNSANFKLLVPADSQRRGLIIQATALVDNKVSAFVAASMAVGTGSGKYQVDPTPGTTAVTLSQALLVGAGKSFNVQTGFRGFSSPTLASLARLAPAANPDVSTLDQSTVFQASSFDAILSQAATVSVVLGTHVAQDAQAAGASAQSAAAATNLIVNSLAAPPPVESAAPTPTPSGDQPPSPAAPPVDPLISLINQAASQVTATQVQQTSAQLASSDTTWGAAPLPTPAPPKPALGLDQTAYIGTTNPVEVSVTDYSAIHNPAATESVAVNVSSLTETTPQTATLTESTAGSGVFTGSVILQHSFDESGNAIPFGPAGTLTVYAEGESSSDVVTVSYGQLTQSAPYTEPPSTVTGIVTVGGVARGGADVQLQGGPSVLQTISRSDGSYAFHGVAPGSYTLVVAVNGAVQGSTAVTVPGATAPSPISISAAP